MPCTELALLPLTTPLSPHLIPKLQIAKHVLETAAGYPCYFYQQVENPSYIYIVGTWDSPQHHERFIPSVQNLGRGIRMWHLQCDALLSLRLGIDKEPEEADSKKKSPFSAPIISCTRYFITSSNKEGFREKFDSVKHVLADEVREYEIEGGWRIEKEAEDKEEWVMFCGWKSVERHLGFGKKEGFREWRGIVDWVDGFEVRHLRRIEGL
ncbi:c14056da-f1eb-42eb-b886-77d1f9d946b2 [Sclerotinia trifoliorum]|uniref:C14056da-f1eb-42eb-b886-77d1f9d946b2 n=1 Tax=Sclerotinia trifoliorum TaxID=28548 RepID=A0A8H2ZL80_9HELO|nr:c14056da-f1eb-42eb-b886-77d1f9d946b2 [Sclerotinia trifoliorum]